MPYTVNFTDSSKDPIVVQDLSTDNSTSITLVGRDYRNYGEFIAENFIHILENFASTEPPSDPIEGQVWYDKQANQLKVFTKNDAWRLISGNFAGNSEPTGADRIVGDIWYNSNNKNLYVFDGTGWIFFASAVIPDAGGEESVPYVTVNTEQVITAHKEFAAGLSANSLTLSNNNAGTLLLDLIDTSAPSDNKVMMRLTGNGNPLLVMNHNAGGDYEFRAGDTAIRIDDGANGIVNLRRVNGAWTTVLGLTNAGIYGSSIATEAESRAKTSNTKIMTPARVYHAVDHFVANTVADGGIQATQAEAEAGVANDVVMTPLRTKQFIDSVGVNTHAQFQLVLPTDVASAGVHAGGYSDRPFNTIVSNTIPTATLSDNTTITTALSGTVDVPRSIYPATFYPSTLTYISSELNQHILLPAGVYMIDVVSFYNPFYIVTDAGSTGSEGSPPSYELRSYPVRGAIRTESNAVLLESSLVTNPRFLFSGIDNIQVITSGIITLSSPTKIKYSTWTPTSSGLITGYNGKFFAPAQTYQTSTPVTSATFDNIRIVKIG